MLQLLLNRGIQVLEFLTLLFRASSVTSLKRHMKKTSDRIGREGGLVAAFGRRPFRHIHNIEFLELEIEGKFKFYSN
jgi:hypothetical protein